MYVSVNSNNEIKEVGITSNPELTSLYIDDDNNPFNGWSKTKICCYKVNVNDDGIVTLISPYVDSRLLEPLNDIGYTLESNEIDIADIQDALCETSVEVEERISAVETNINLMMTILTKNGLNPEDILDI